MISEEALSAYLDGEATAAQSQIIEAALQRDPALRARLDRLAENDRNLKAAMDGLLVAPVPDRLAQAVRGAMAAREAGSSNDNAPQQRRPRGDWPRRAFWPGSIAAALVLGVLVGQFAHLGAAGDWISGPGAPRAGSEVARALGTAASGARVTLASNRSLTPVMTFISRDGSLCRQFAIDGPAARQTGLACRAGQSWRLVALVAAASATGDYKTAAGPGQDAVSAMADRLIQGDPMEAGAEAAALRRH